MITIQVTHPLTAFAQSDWFSSRIANRKRHNVDNDHSTNSSKLLVLISEMNNTELNQVKNMLSGMYYVTSVSLPTVVRNCCISNESHRIG